MIAQDVTLRIPDRLYRRLQQNAVSTQRPIEEVMLHALDAGSPPDWDDVPAEFQADLAALDRLDDDALWRIAADRKAADDPAYERYNALAHRLADGGLTEAEVVELERLQFELDRFMLRKAHAAVLLRWRGHNFPPLLDPIR